jgi:hypothetical protein
MYNKICTFKLLIFGKPLKMEKGVMSRIYFLYLQSSTPSLCKTLPIDPNILKDTHACKLTYASRQR